MRIETSGKKAWRSDLYERTANNLNESTKAGGIDAACVFVNEMLDNLDRALEHDDMTPELAELLSTRSVKLRYELTTAVEID